MTRKHSPTSKAGEEFIKPHKPSHKERILEALRILKIGGTHEEISIVAGMRADQVWKRLSELEKDQHIFSTGVTRKLKSGLHGTVWQIMGDKVVDTSVIKIPAKNKKATSASNQQPFFTI